MIKKTFFFLILYFNGIFFIFRYDPNRIIAYQGRKPERFYYIMTGKGKHFEIKYIFVNYECNILCSDNENININIYLI